MNTTKTAAVLLVAAALGTGAWSPAAAQSERYTERDRNGFRTGTIDVKPDGSRTYRDARGFRTGTARYKGGDLVLRDARGYRTGKVQGPRR